MEINDKQIREVLEEKSLSRDICSKLNINDRQWREVVNRFNSQYDKKERLIVSDNKGYELTTNKKLIKAYAIRLIKHSLSELKNAKTILKTLSEKDQLKILDDEETDLVDIAMKMKV